MRWGGTGKRRGRHVRAVVIAAMTGIGLLLPVQPVAAGEPQMRFAARDTGFRAGEPTLGVLQDGSIVYQALTKVIKSTDEGRSWTQVHEPPSDGVTFDPYIHVDAVTDRIISSQLLVACQMLSISDDGGSTWIDAPTQCGTGDHQKIGSGPWAAGGVSSPLFPRAVYSCVNHVADTACAVSLDGGLTWGPLVTVFPGVDPSAEQGVFVPGVCGGLEGDPVSGPDGTIYVPREYCGRPFLGISRDNGLTWTLRWVAPPAQTRPIAFGANNPAVSVGQDGTIFYAWTGDDWRHHVARSTDGGATWTSWRVSPPAVRSTTFPLVIAGRAGAVATAYLGTRDTELGPDGAPEDARWHLFVTFSTSAGTSDPAWETVQVTPGSDPVMIGCIGRHGPDCGGKGSLLDFNDIALTPDGRLAISYADACLKPGCVDDRTSRAQRGFLAIQTDGTRIS